MGVRTKRTGFVQNGLNSSVTGKYKMAAIMVGFQMVGLPDFRSHTISEPFANQFLFDHLKSRQGHTSDPQCTGLIWYSDPHSNGLVKSFIEFFFLCCSDPTLCLLITSKKSFDNVSGQEARREAD